MSRPTMRAAMDGAAPHTAEPTSNTTRPALNMILLSNFLNRLQLEASVSDSSLNPRPPPHVESAGYSPKCVRHRYPRQIVHTTPAQCWAAQRPQPYCPARRLRSSIVVPFLPRPCRHRLSEPAKAKNRTCFLPGSCGLYGE